MLALIPLFPLVGFLVNGSWYLFGQAPKGCKKASSRSTGGIATFFIFLSFLVSLVIFFQLYSSDPGSRSIHEVVGNWIHVGTLDLVFGFRVDSLSTLFTLVITGVGTLIHIYSIGYMSHDETPGKFFAYLNLFCFAMLMLVLGSSLPILFLGWEGVGLCSYLLIGYWYADIEKAKAGKKAFIVNRIGDLGFLLGMFLIFSTFGSLDFEALRLAVGTLGHAGGALPIDPDTVTAICLLLFVGCMGKSAQIPLYVWLPDAMAGPTPVSALIHAATMVTSGIYLVARLNFLYSLSPVALSVIATIGALTAFFAATIALVQTDIKKILAYSTISQLGYMFLACGVGAYAAGVFHVITHAFFKALLFLGAGSVIHGMHEEQDIWKMGGLRGKMPKTFLTFAVGWFSICGIPPFSGFFSKDEILWQAYSSPHGSTLLWGLGVVTAVMTAFYMTRLFSLTFLGTSRFGAVHESADAHHSKARVHESPHVMILPLQALAVLSLMGGLMGIPHMSWIEHWLEPVIPSHLAVSGVVSESGAEWVLMAFSILCAVSGILLALRMYSDLDRVSKLADQFGTLYEALRDKWYVDEIYDMIIIRPLEGMSNFLWKIIDIRLIDQMVVGFGRVSSWAGDTARIAQTGSIQIYALMLLIGLVATVGYFAYAWI
jgi:NADH-quinone oxidoreductase subunit L